MKRVTFAGACFLSVVLACPAAAVEHAILGKKVVVRDPTGVEENRSVVVIARESATSATIAGDPTVDGATLRITTAGGTAVDAFYPLFAFNWRSVSGGWVYRGLSGTQPVQRVVLKRTGGAVALLKVVLRGSVGGRDVDVVPPNPGTAAVAMLIIHNGGGRYCASFGGAAGGTIGRNTPALFRLRNPTAAPPCPADPPQHCCDFGGSQTCAWAADAEECTEAGGRPGDGDSVCDSASGLCTPPPPVPGFCCGGATTVFGTNCAAGPGVAAVCSFAGGTLFPSAVCTTSGTCASPSGAFVDASATPF